MIKINEPEYKFDKNRFDLFCSKYNFRFPESFVNFLQRYNDAELEPNVLDIIDNECCVRYFYGTSKEGYCDIWSMYEDYKSRLPSQCIPIADPDLGNLICMSLAKDSYGCIYFWDHETMDTDNQYTVKLKDMIKIADSFNMLLENIKEDDDPIVFENKNSISHIISKFFNKK